MQPETLSADQFKARYGAPTSSATPVSSSTQQPSAPVTLSADQFKQQYGTPNSDGSIAPPTKSGGVSGALQSFAKSVFSVPATLIARPFQAAAEAVSSAVDAPKIDSFQTQLKTLQGQSDDLYKKAMAAKSAGQDAAPLIAQFSAKQKEIQDHINGNNPLLQDKVDAATAKIPLVGGLIAPVDKNYGDVKKDVGRAAELVAMGTGAPIAGGALFGAGNSLEQGNDLFSAQTALDAVLGAGAGKVGDWIGKPLLNKAGAVIGKITPLAIKNVAAKGAQAVTDFAATHNLPLGISKIAAPVSKAIERGTNAVDSTIGAGLSKTAGGAKSLFQNQYPGGGVDTFGNKLDNAEKSIYPNLSKNEKATSVLKDQKGLFGTKSVPDLQNNPATKPVIESVANLPDDIQIKPSDSVAVKDSKLNQGISRLHQDTANALNTPQMKAQTSFKPAQYDSYMKKNVLDPIESEFGKTSKEYTTAKKAIGTSKKGLTENNAYGSHTGRQNFDTQFKKDNPRAFKLQKTLFGQLDPNVTSTVEAGVAVRNAMNDFTESLLPKGHPYRFRLREESNLIKGLGEMRRRSTGELDKNDVQRYLNRNPAIKRAAKVGTEALKIGTGVRLLDLL